MISIDLWFTCHLMKCSTSLVSGLIGLYMYERERHTHTDRERCSNRQGPTKEKEATNNIKLGTIMLVSQFIWVQA